MNHLTEEQLVLYYYGESAEAPEVEQHLEGCDDCRTGYAGLQSVLNLVDSAPVPEPAADYAEQVWNRLGTARRRRFHPASWLRPRRWAAAAAMAALLMGAFLAGRFSPRPKAPITTAAAPGQVRERILLVAVGDHLERSQMVLVELANARSSGALDISAEQERAEDLISENRLYRQTAAGTGDAAVAGVLDELERVLLDIARGPSTLTPAELERVRQRIEAEGILFKVRVLGSNVRQREEKAEIRSRESGARSQKL